MYVYIKFIHTRKKFDLVSNVKESVSHKSYKLNFLTKKIIFYED